RGMLTASVVFDLLRHPAERVLHTQRRFERLRKVLVGLGWLMELGGIGYGAYLIDQSWQYGDWDGHWRSFLVLGVFALQAVLLFDFKDPHSALYEPALALSQSCGGGG